MTPGSGPVDAWGTSRVSRLFPDQGMLVHADLHNHTLLSDGRGDPRSAFGSMRANGLDVAAITDHTLWESGVAGWLGPRVRSRLSGMDPTGWRILHELAEAADEPGAFVAMRGFEWSHPVLGHISVWGSARYTDPLRVHGLTFTRTMRKLYRWLDGPGADGLAGFNHPGTAGRLRFGGFGLEPMARGRVVSMEMFNKLDDYLHGEPSPAGAVPWRRLAGGADRGHRRARR
jgi:hypothetical protein